DSDCSSKEEHFTDDEGHVSREKLNSHVKGVNSEIDRLSTLTKGDENEANSIQDCPNEVRIKDEISSHQSQRGYNDETLNERSKLVNELYDRESLEDLEIAQKVKVRWSIEGDENTKYCQAEEMECTVSYNEIKQAVWDYGTNKFPDPDGFSFEFFRDY
ncbi:hypothetical protein Tco_1077891, partial [Tanacetum coccineum]